MSISKDDYILRNFSKIKHKKWELYVITRIIHFLNDSDVEFVCQQLIRTHDGKRYLADLCFPSLKLYYEIDEAQHGTDKHKIKDEHRHREIIDATNFIEKRITVFDKNKKDRDINQINIEVDEFIDFIKKSLKEFEKLKQEEFSFEKQDPKKHSYHMIINEDEKNIQSTNPFETVEDVASFAKSLRETTYR